MPANLDALALAPKAVAALTVALIVGALVWRWIRIR